MNASARRYITAGVGLLLVILFAFLVFQRFAEHTHFTPAGETVQHSRVCIPFSTCSGAPNEHRHCAGKFRPGHFVSKSLAKKNGDVRDVVKADRNGESNCHNLGFNLDGHQAVTDYTDGSPTKRSGTSDHKRDGQGPEPPTVE